MTFGPKRGRSVALVALMKCMGSHGPWWRSYTEWLRRYTNAGPLGDSIIRVQKTEPVGSITLNYTGLESPARGIAKVHSSPDFLFPQLSGCSTEIRFTNF